MITLIRGGKGEFKFSKEHAENILNSPINDQVKDESKYALAKDGEWKMKDGKLVKKEKKK